MALGNQSKKGMGSKWMALSPKQKLQAIVVVVLFIFVIWMGAGLFSSHAPAVKKTSANKTAKVNNSHSTISTSPHPTGVHPNQQIGGQQAPVVLAQTPVMAFSRDAELMNQQRQAQKDYLSSLNQLQTLKVQREIAEANQAITIAKLATVTAEKNMSDLLKPPAPPTVPAVPLGAYANKLSSPVQSADGSAPIVVEAVPDYVVISVSMQFNKWNAVIGYQGKLYSVTVGDTLPADGSVVASISKQGVVLKKDGNKRKIEIVSSI